MKFYVAVLRVAMWVHGDEKLAVNQGPQLVLNQSKWLQCIIGYLYSYDIKKHVTNIYKSVPLFISTLRE